MENSASSWVSGLVVQARDVRGNLTVHHHEPRSGAVAVVTRVDVASAGAFVGRGAESDRVLAMLAPAAVPGSEGVVGPVVAGMGGVGKTALAQYCAEVAVRRDWFPGGVFWVNLQGYTRGGEVAAEAVFAPLLRQLGVPGDQIPAAAGEQSDMYSQTLRGLAASEKWVLLVLDNASASAQVRGLVPGGGGHRVVVTTRDTLALPGVRRSNLDILSVVEAVDLLDEWVHGQNPDDHRVRVDQDGGRRLAGVCGGLPLALWIAAGVLADEANLSPGGLAEQLLEASTEAFAYGEACLATVFTPSYDRLQARAPAAARMLRLLALVSGVDISTEAAAALAGVPVGEARAVLRTVRQAHLLELIGGRWRLHDLIRRHIVDTCHAPDAHDEYQSEVGYQAGQGRGSSAQQALRRLIDYYVDTGHAAQRLIDPRSRKIPLPIDVAKPVIDHPSPPRNAAQAYQWFEAEYACLIEGQQVAQRERWHKAAYQLAWALASYCRRRGRLEDLVTIWRAGLSAAEQLNNPTAQEWGHRILGHALSRDGSHQEGAEHLRRADALGEKTGDALGRAIDQRLLARNCERKGEFAQALLHAERCVDLYQSGSLKHAFWESDALAMVAWCHAQLSNYERAQDYCNRAIALLRKIRHEDGEVHEDGEADVLRTLGYISHCTGKYVQALDYYRESASIFRSVRNVYREADALEALGQIHAALGQYTQACDAWHGALKLYQVQHRSVDVNRLQRQLLSTSDAVEN